jgi:hypothetical protein
MPSGIKKAMKVAFAGLEKLRSSDSYSDHLSVRIYFQLQITKATKFT